MKKIFLQAIFLHEEYNNNSQIDIHTVSHSSYKKEECNLNFFAVLTALYSFLYETLLVSRDIFVNCLKTKERNSFWPEESSFQFLDTNV